MAKYLAHIAITLIAIGLMVYSTCAYKLCDEGRMKSCMEPLQTYLNSPGQEKLADLPADLYPISGVADVCFYSYPNTLKCMWKEMLYCDLDFATDSELFDLHNNLTVYCGSTNIDISPKDDACLYTTGCVNALSDIFRDSIISSRFKDPAEKELICKYAKTNSEKCMEIKSQPCSVKKNREEELEILWAMLDYNCKSKDIHSASEVTVHPALANGPCDVGRMKKCIEPLKRYIQNPGSDILAPVLCENSYQNMLFCIWKEMLYCDLDFATDSELFDLHNSLAVYCGSKDIDIAPAEEACLYEEVCLFSLDIFFHGGLHISSHFYDATPTEKELLCKYAKSNADNCIKMKSETCSLSEEGKKNVQTHWQELDHYCNPRNDSDVSPYIRLECITHKKDCMKPLQEFLDQPGPRTLAGLTEGDARITEDKEVCKYAYKNELQCLGKKLLYCDFSWELGNELEVVYRKFTKYCKMHGENVEESETDASCREHATMCTASLEEFLHGNDQSVRLHANDTTGKEKELICKHAVENIGVCVGIKKEICGPQLDVAEMMSKAYKLGDDLRLYCEDRNGGEEQNSQLSGSDQGALHIDTPDDQPSASSGQNLPQGNPIVGPPHEQKGLMHIHFLFIMNKDIKVCVRAFETGRKLPTDASDSLALYKLIEKFYECTIKATSNIVEATLSYIVNWDPNDCIAKPYGLDRAEKFSQIFQYLWTLSPIGSDQPAPPTNKTDNQSSASFKQVNITKKQLDDQPGASAGRNPEAYEYYNYIKDKSQMLKLEYQLDIMTEDIKVCIRALPTGRNLTTDTLDSLALYKLLEKFYGCTKEASSIIVEDTLSNAVNLEPKDCTA